jgi:hypothetical protein
MILKNFINLFSVLNIIFIVIFIFLINKFLVTSNIREKFFLFICLFLIMISIGLYYNLDGIIMLFMISELSVLLIFITMFSQLYSFDKKKKKISTIIILIIILTINFEFYSTNLISYSNFYSNFNININDFYYMYNSYFEKQILITILTTFILTFYSIFFILLYFNFKKIQNFEVKKINKIILLRKQNLIHQSNYNSNIRLFQNK